MARAMSALGTALAAAAHAQVPPAQMGLAQAAPAQGAARYRAELTRAPEAYPFFQFGVIVNAKTRAEVGFASRLGCR